MLLHAFAKARGTPLEIIITASTLHARFSEYYS